MIFTRGGLTPFLGNISVLKVTLNSSLLVGDRVTATLTHNLAVL